MKKYFVLAVLMLLVTACYPTIKNTNQEQQQPTQNTTQSQTTQAQPQFVNATLPAKFVITARSAVRDPPTVSGSIKNTGLGGGPANVVAKIFYAGNIASQRNRSFSYIKPDEEVNFTTSFDKTIQWTSYSVTIE